MRPAAGSTVLVFCDESNGVCGLVRSERFDDRGPRNTIAAVDSQGITNWMVWPGTSAFVGEAYSFAFSEKAWRVDDPTHLEVAGQLGLFHFDERPFAIALQTSDRHALEAPWIRGAKDEVATLIADTNALTPDRRIRRILSAPARALSAWRAREGAARSIAETMVGGTLNVDGREATLDGFGWIETSVGGDLEASVDSMSTISLRGDDGAHLLVEIVTSRSVPRTRGRLRRGNVFEPLSTAKIEGGVPLVGKSAAVSIRVQAGTNLFEWTGDISSLISEPVQERGAYATRRLVRFSRKGKHVGIGSFFAREYP